MLSTKIYKKLFNCYLYLKLINQIYEGLVMLVNRLKNALSFLLTGKNPLEERLYKVNLRNKELKETLSERVEALNQKLEVLRSQSKAKDMAIETLNMRVNELKEKLSVARTIIQRNSNNDRTLDSGG